MYGDERFGEQNIIVMEYKWKMLNINLDNSYE